MQILIMPRMAPWIILRLYVSRGIAYLGVCDPYRIDTMVMRKAMPDVAELLFTWETTTSRFCVA